MMESAEQKARRWRLRAEEMRTMAAGMRHADAVRDLVLAAGQLERMASRSEAQRQPQPGESHSDAAARRRRRGASYAARRTKFLALES